jgi:hypothetical protein
MKGGIMVYLTTKLARDATIWTNQMALADRTAKNSEGGLSHRDGQVTLSAVLVALAIRRHLPQRRC